MENCSEEELAWFKFEDGKELSDDEFDLIINDKQFNDFQQYIDATDTKGHTTHESYLIYQEIMDNPGSRAFNAMCNRIEKMYAYD